MRWREVRQAGAIKGNGARPLAGSSPALDYYPGKTLLKRVNMTKICCCQAKKITDRPLLLPTLPETPRPR
jgi:hypothetical protein